MTLLSNDDIDMGGALALASVIGRRDDCKEIAHKVANYCTATLRDPRAVYAANAISELDEVVTTLDSEPRDLGCVFQYVALDYRWRGIAHETLHMILGECPDA